MKLIDVKKAQQFSVLCNLNQIFWNISPFSLTLCMEQSMTNSSAFDETANVTKFVTEIYNYSTMINTTISQSHATNATIRTITLAMKKSPILITAILNTLAILIFFLAMFVLFCLVNSK